MSRVIDAAVKKSTDRLSAFERNAAKVGRGMVKGGAMIAGAGAAVGATMFNVGKSAADYAGSVKDASDSTGIGTEAWQKMAYAAKISGIEQEKMMGAMVKFDKLLTDAAAGSKTAGQIFTDLGIRIKDAGGKMRAPEAVFEDVAELLSHVEEGATKTAAACAFFGKSGAELLPMLNEGRGGLQGLYKAAEDTGNVLSEEALNSADEFGKSLEAVTFHVKGVMLQVGTALIPVLSEMKDWVSGVIGKVGDWLKANPELAATIGKVATWGGVLLLGLGLLSVAIGSLTFIVAKLGSVFRGTMAIFSAGKKVIGGVRAAIGFAKVAIAGMRKAEVAANAATRAYMVSQSVAATQTKAYAAGKALAAAKTWLFNTAVGFAKTAIVGMRKACVAANVATRAYMKTQNVAAIRTKAYAAGQALAAAKTWLFNTALYGCPIVWIIAGIVAVVAIVIWMVKNWEKVSAFFKRLWDGIKKIFSAVWEWIKNMFLNYTPVGLVIKHWSSIKAWFSKLWEEVKNVFRSVWEWIKNMFLNYTPVGLVIKHWNSIKAWFSKLWEGVKNVFRATWEWIKKMFLNYTPVGLVIKHWDSIKGWFSGLWDGVKGVFVSAWDGIKGFFSEMNPVEWLSDMWSGISEFFSGLWQRFKQWGRQIIQGLIDGITGMAKKAIDGIKNIGRKIANGFKSFFGIHSPSTLFAEYGANITAGLTVGIDSGTEKVGRSTARMADRANRGFSRNIEAKGSGDGRIGQVNREMAAGNRAATVSASQIANTIGGTSVTYAPQITVAAGAAGSIEPDLRKLLKEHERDIVEIVERAAANRARLSFA